MRALWFTLRRCTVPGMTISPVIDLATTRLRDDGKPLKTRDRAIAAEVRAEMARQKPDGITQEHVAREVFSQDQQWLSRRLAGKPALSGAELVALADYLKVDVVPWLAAGRPSPIGGSPTVGKVAPYLRIVRGEADTTARRTGHLGLLLTGS